jgi:antirestriction protein ArdC
MRPGPHRDLAQTVTNLIVAKLEQGVKPWQRSWTCAGQGGLPRKHDGMPYRGINTLALWAAADENGYRSAYWMTHRQANELGGTVRRGERASISIYSNKFRKREANLVTGGDSSKLISFLRANAVYNADQIDNLPPYYYVSEDAFRLPAPVSEHQAGIDAFFTPIPVKILYGGNKAYYSPAYDHIRLPKTEHFRSIDHAASTKAHELCHATGAKHRLNRTFGKAFKDTEYCLEELVAETGAALICAELGLPVELHDSHASYIDHYIKALKANKTAIFLAAAKAEAACAWLRQWSKPCRGTAQCAA